MKTKLILLFMSLVFLTSCEPKVLDNERWTVQGKVTDTSGNPIEGIQISTRVQPYHLSRDVSDEDGNFNFITLGTDREYFEILINIKKDLESPQIQQEWNSVMLYYENRDQFQPIFDIGVIKLRPIAKLHLKIEGNPASADNLQLDINYATGVYQKNINLDTEPQQGYEQYRNFSKIIPTSAGYEQEFNSLLNSVVNLQYSINDGPRTQISIPLTEIENTYVLQL